ncbi:hypothetical protein FD04_GL001493 [Secundilactobacillus odoratitofui DSM 19909 = JCM 15043]|uniref:Uncharacterized protein n=1 Tax=Secundilactobacillus odoratitofui DSM 19909 = JCM 15043 TaxID=1423776 RepID=A0A0R1LYD7_9LACO|nr:hypothetical protein FD04_GL001493 [Secundilactobacillus odoratitofui DSM 19909 = JCM 15043]
MTQLKNKLITSKASRSQLSLDYFEYRSDKNDLTSNFVEGILATTKQEEATT